MTQHKTSLFNLRNLPTSIKLGLPLFIAIFFTSLQVVISVYYAVFGQLDSWLLWLPVLNLIVLILFWIIFTGYFSTRLKELAEASDLISKGKLDTSLEENAQDEIGVIAQSILNLADSIHKAREFTQNIGAGNYHIDNLKIHSNGHDDSLFLSLISMRDQLKDASEKDSKQNWITKGMEEFTEILRSNDTDLRQLCSKVIKGLVRYINAQQGVLFVVNNENQDELFLEMIASYAYNETEIAEKKVMIVDNFAEGLIGQAYLEKDTIYLTDVPVEYHRVASGLGESRPSSVLIIPLELNGNVEGVIEISTFDKLQDHQIAFIERLTENIASAILSIKVNEHTKKLLKESQELTQRLQAQEEEMRQNYEELQATQEMVENKNKLIEEQKKSIEKALAEQNEKNEMLLAQEEAMRQNMEELVVTQEQMMITQIELDGQLNAINNSTVCKVEFDLEGKIITANQSFCHLVGYELDELKGISQAIFVESTVANSEQYENFWQNLRQGIPQMGDFKRFDKKGKEIWINAVYSPVFNKKGKVYKIIKLAFDITEAKKLLEETQSQAKILREQERVLRKSMEELKITQEELNQKSQAIIAMKEEEAVYAQQKAKEIESKNQLITSSIQYAQNIQRAILPSEDVMKETIEDVMVIYLPKDIVSGDFYWYSHIENKVFFAAVDCTGHGVPGAFMSIIGNTILNELVNVQQIFDTGKILELLHKGIRYKLRQKESRNQDGMDVALCMLETLPNQKIKISFSGAKRSLYYIERENPSEFLEIKGDRTSIGGWQHEEDRTFVMHQIVVSKGSHLYLITDGIIDNPNVQRKKFGIQKFKELITENIEQSLKQQKNLILEAIITHQEGVEQRDDITVLGIKL